MMMTRSLILYWASSQISLALRLGPTALLQTKKRDDDEPLMFAEDEDVFGDTSSVRSNIHRHSNKKGKKHHQEQSSDPPLTLEEFGTEIKSIYEEGSRRTKEIFKKVKAVMMIIIFFIGDG
jgi:hypothetical protein